MNILVIDDDVISQNVVASIVEALGDVDTADDGNEGLEQFQVNLFAGMPYDVVVTDYLMGGMNGREMVARMREMEAAVAAEKKARVVFVTSLKELDDQEAFLAESAPSAFITKPVERERLLAVINSL